MSDELMLVIIMKRSTTMLDFYKRKGSNSSEVNVGLPTINVAIPILENVDVPILENIYSPISENVDVPISRTIHSPILENVDIPILENNHISQTQFQKVDLDSLDYDPGTCKKIWEYHVNQLDEIRRAYIKSAIAFRGRDESFSSFNLGNFLESLGIVTFWNEKVTEIIANASKNVTYTSPRIQKKILHVFSAKVKKAIREEIGDAKFCIMVNEAHDESVKKQMAMVFRYVDAEGFVKERFFVLIHVVDTAALTLKNGIYSLLSQHCLDVQNIRGQGYDGPSNMQVKASKQVVPISGLFFKLLFLIKIVNASCKRNEQLKVANANEIARLIDLEELETGSGLNQISTLQRPPEIRWSSHFRSVSSLLRMFTSTIEVLLNIIDDASDGEYRAETESAYDGLTSFEFVFILHLEKETMEITDKLC
ncbi:hypothetical protein SO802_032125 [Lithocarpus litseifolius]|uniref:DUF4371 domain-containing protein n=1 Tax=Lithocarpus litseifolius TaxID=425828 RepID=A0AAW2BMD9_9ROSI